MAGLPKACGRVCQSDRQGPTEVTWRTNSSAQSSNTGSNDDYSKLLLWLVGIGIPVIFVVLHLTVGTRTLSQ